MKDVLINKIDNDFDKELASVFEQEGYKVYTAETIKNENTAIDIYIDTSNEQSDADTFTVRSGLNDEVIRKLYDANVIKPMSMLEKFLPLLERGAEKRLCFLSSAQACINEAVGTDGLGYRMAKAGLHNFLQITRNVLAPKGYTIRVFDPMLEKISAAQAAGAAFNYFTRRRGIEQGDPNRDDEGNIVLRDACGRQHCW